MTSDEELTNNENADLVVPHFDDELVGQLVAYFVKHKMNFREMADFMLYVTARHVPPEIVAKMKADMYAMLKLRQVGDDPKVLSDNTSDEQ